MHIGDLPRTRTARTALGGPIIRAMFVLVAVCSAAGGWMVLSSAPKGGGLNNDAPARKTAAVVVHGDTARKPESRPLPSRTAPLQVASAGPVDAMPSAGVPLGGPMPSRSGTEADPAAMPLPARSASDAPPAPVPQAVPSGSGASSTADTAGPGPSASGAAGGSDVTGAVGREASLQADPKPAGDLIDLNTGSFDQLNSLEGGGPIGRAIIKGRPYASTEDLVRKKILRRSVYDHIKDQVTVR